MTQRNGRRCSAAVAYLDNAKSRKNLAIFTDAQARHAVFDGRRAVGVEFSQKRAVKRVAARREIIFCGGRFNRRNC